ncbi:mitochondrial matrix iron-sulfur protein [Didymella glomerata]|uniref:Mitochondrial matrix iron-sulfur protein n=1 Tax=Didymella glomerata TaxID=749621 RepID=A0A9W8WSZ9_9PLEO|nr:mitochondrial matrix iron-sulfur protein [Didymella glomerata]
MLLEPSQPLGVPEHRTRQENFGTAVAADFAHCVCGRGVAESLLVEPCLPPRAPRQAEARRGDGQSHTFEVGAGDNLLDIAQANDLEMEGACGGSCACSTCHVIVEDEAKYDAMEEPDDDENDMLDLAFGLTETSRLGCQVKMSKELDGLVVKLPSMTRNLQASDFK